MEKFVTSYAAEYELGAKKVAAVRREYEWLHGFRFDILWLPKRNFDYQTARMFWSMFVGAAIAFSMTVVAVVFTRRLRRPADS